MLPLTLPLGLANLVAKLELMFLLLVLPDGPLDPLLVTWLDAALSLLNKALHRRIQLGPLAPVVLPPVTVVGGYQSTATQFLGNELDSPLF